MVGLPKAVSFTCLKPRSSSAPVAQAFMLVASLCTDLLPGSPPGPSNWAWATIELSSNIVESILIVL